MEWRILLAALLLGAAIAGCDHPDTPTFEYLCANSRRVSVTYFRVPEPGRATVEADDVTYELPHVISASGARFSDGKVTWWEHGGEAELLQGGAEMECVELNP